MFRLLILSAVLAQFARAETPPESCQADALSRGRLGELEIVELCAGAVNSEPLQCWERAVDERGLSKQAALLLCPRAVSAQSVLDCHEAASLDGRFSRSDAIELCARTPAGAAPVLCAQEALNYWISPEDASLLCARSPSAAPVHCYQRSVETGMSRGRARELCAVPR